MVQERGASGGSIHVALDETFAPVVGVCAVIVEQSYLNMNRDIKSLYDDLSGDFYMRDLESFEKFVKSGFHKTADPYEVSTRFINFLSKTFGFKTIILFSDRTTRPDLSDYKLVLVLYAEAVRLIIERHRSRSEIVFHFEQNDRLNRYFEPLVQSAGRKVRGRKPLLVTEVNAKMNPPLLAVADYALHTFGSWWIEKAGRPATPMDAQDNRWRDMRAIRRSISLIRSIEHGTIAKRDLPDLIGGSIDV